jgi:hypothetical protein
MAVGSPRCLRLPLITLGRRMLPYLRPDACGVWLYQRVWTPAHRTHVRDAASSNRGALPLIAGIMAISTLLPILVRPPRNGDTDRTEIESHLSRKRWA